MRKPVVLALSGAAILAAAAIAVVVNLVSPERPEAPAPTVATPDPVIAQSASVPAAQAVPVPDPAAPGSAPAAATAAASAPRTTASAASPVRSSFALSSEHRALLQEASIASADLRTLEREERDNDWAAEAERRIRAELAAHPSFADFDIVAIDCRQSLCAIQAFSYGDSGNVKWVSAFDDLYKQSLAQAFDSVSSAFPNEGTRSAVLTFLHRKAGAKP